MISRRRLTAVGSASLLALAAFGMPLDAAAQAWPGKQAIKILSPYAPGGTTDVLARMIGAKLQEKLGQTVIVENRAGAGGNIGTDAIAKALPDGYSLLLAASGPIVIAPSLYPKLPYSPMKDSELRLAARQRLLRRPDAVGLRHQHPQGPDRPRPGRQQGELRLGGLRHAAAHHR